MENEMRCPQRLALKVRPGLAAGTTDSPPRSRLEDYPLGPLNRVLDLVEFDGLSTETAVERWRERPSRPCHPGLIEWTVRAVRNYLAAAADLAAGAHEPVLEPVSRGWARQRDTQVDGTPTVHEETVLGRRYASAEMRELRILRVGSVEKRAKDPAETALAADVVAAARPVLSSWWRKAERFVLGSIEPARRVRVTEIGCADGSRRILFEGTAAEAHDNYRRDAWPRLRTVAAGSEYRPGSDCGSCGRVASCPAVPSRPGLLGVVRTDAPRRTWAMSTGRDYATCPARAHLRDLFHTGAADEPESDAVRRGKAVHAWIEERHRRRPLRPCDAADAPASAESGRLPLVGTEGRLAVQMIGDHALVCPLQGLPENAEVQPERPVTAFDPDSGVVVIAKTDLLYRAADRWVLRETKTARALDGGDPLARYPQVALGVVLAAAGVLPGGPGGCRVELERLTATGPVMNGFDADDPDTVDRARRVILGYVAEWHADEQFKARPGPECAACPFAGWCPDAAPEKRP